MLAHGIRRSIGSSGASGHWAVEYRNSDGYASTCCTVGTANQVYVGLLTGTTTGIAEISSAGLPVSVYTHALSGGAGTIINGISAGSGGVVAGGAFLPGGNTKTETLYGAVSGADLDYRTISQNPTNSIEVNDIAVISGVKSCIVGPRGASNCFIAIEDTGVTTVHKEPTGTNIRAVAANGSYLFFGVEIHPNFVGLGRSSLTLTSFAYNGFGMGGTDHSVPEIAFINNNLVGICSATGNINEVFKTNTAVTSIDWARDVGTANHTVHGVAVDSSDNVYVLLYYSNVVYISKYNTSGVYQAGWSIALAGTTSLALQSHSLSMTSDDRMVFSLTANNTPADDSTWVFCLPTDGTGLGTYGDVTFASSTVADALGSFAFQAGYASSVLNTGTGSDATGTATGTSQNLTPATIGL